MAFTLSAGDWGVLLNIRKGCWM